MCQKKPANIILFILLAILTTATASLADGGVRFDDIAIDEKSGIDYQRVRSPRSAILDEIMQQPIFFIPEDLPRTPLKGRGAPGVAIFDYDRDGDLDLYVTNGPGAANSLYSNQLQETRDVSFIDVAEAAGVAAIDQDSSGVCFGDIDNDGDHDLVVLGMDGPNYLFQNEGDGTFVDISIASGIDGGLSENSASCSLGDVNNDGWLDLYIGNFAAMENQFPIYVEPFSLNEHNRLYLNQGGNLFEDVSVTSGIRDLAGFPPEAAGLAGATWAVAMVDYDQDGDVDLFSADDQGAIFSTARGGIDRGLIHIHQNDGEGQFVDVAVTAQVNKFGTWMGLSFGDFNSDGRLDFFASNLGDYAPVFTGFELGDFDVKTSRWFLAQADGTFSDPGIGDLRASAFGWGTSAFDYDNDGDTDILMHGGLDFGNFIDATNPGVPMQNDGQANFSYDFAAMSESTDHLLRTVHGSAVGDLDGNGFVDIVSVSNFDIPPDVEKVFTPIPYGTPLDEMVFTINTFVPTGEIDPEFGIPLNFVPNSNLPPFPDGSLAVELNDGGNAQGWIEVTLKGSVGLVDGARSNRDGIGGVVALETRQGKRQLQPILGGSSYASQDSLAANFGLGDDRMATIDVLWPGGVRNRLYQARQGEKINFPEIPCSYDQRQGFLEFSSCVADTLATLHDLGRIDTWETRRFFVSQLRAYFEHRLLR